MGTEEEKRPVQQKPRQSKKEDIYESKVTEDFTSKSALELCDEWKKNYINAFEYCSKYNINKQGMWGFVEAAEKFKTIEKQL